MTATPIGEAKKKRLVSVDVMRGLAVGWMILTNNPGDYMHVFREMVHAKWNGWTATDFVFPTFLFLVGVSAALAINKDKVKAGEIPHFWRKTFKRTAILFALGLFENAFPHFDLHHLRIPGVLQRIAIVYLAVVWLNLKLSNKGVLTLVAVILIGYCALLKDVPVPGYGAPSLDTAVNLEGWLDQKVLHGHIWEYDTNWDPEGILSTFPAIAMGLIGLLCGRWLRSGDETQAGLFFLYGFFMHIGGLIWNIRFPINKNLFTSSFTLFVGGAATMLLVLLHYRLDVEGKTRFTKPFLALGTNSLTIYVASEIISVLLFMIKVPVPGGHSKCLHFFLYDIFFEFWKHHYVASLAWSLSFLGVLLIPTWIMYKRGIVIKI
jgi:predicted acyltransferase